MKLKESWQKNNQKTNNIFFVPPTVKAVRVEFSFQCAPDDNGPESLAAFRAARIEIEKLIHSMSRTFSVLILVLVFLVGGGTQLAKAQDFAIKTNLLYDATATLNLGAEVGLAPRWTFDVSGNYHPWDLPSKPMIRHAMLQPELRYWFCDRFSRHFIGVHALGGIYNIANLPTAGRKFFGRDLTPLSKYRYQGWFVGAGVAYGYDFILGEHWNLELEVGVGYIYTMYDKFECEECGLQLAYQVPVKTFAPTKAAINLVYLF